MPGRSVGMVVIAKPVDLEAMAVLAEAETFVEPVRVAAADVA